MVVVADEFDRSAEQSAAAVDVLPPNVLGKPCRPGVACYGAGQRQAATDTDWGRCAGHVVPLQPPARAAPARSCCSQAKATALAPPCSRTTLATPAAVFSRAQSRCHSPNTASQVIGTAPAATMRRTAISWASAETPPEASVTMNTSYPPPSAWIAGIARQISV